jgi:hypothetical protein
VGVLADGVLAVRGVEVIGVTTVALAEYLREIAPAVRLHELDRESFLAVNVVDCFVHDVDRDALVRKKASWLRLRRYSTTMYWVSDMVRSFWMKSIGPPSAAGVKTMPSVVPVTRSGVIQPWNMRSIPLGKVGVRPASPQEPAAIAGTLRWAKGLYPGNTRTLSGTHPVQWRDHSSFEGPYGTFRWLAIEVVELGPQA